MMRSMAAAVSGLRNTQTGMDVIGNNIANVNTTAFKYSTTSFQDILSQTMQGASAATSNRGGINPIQIGLGMGVASISTDFTDGSYQPTGNNANLGIQGQGFFVLSDGNEQVYSRAGNFDFDTNGNYIVNGTGYKVQGWAADASGNIATTGALTSLSFPKGMSIEGKTTDRINFAYNLSKDATVGSTGMGSITVYDTYGSPHKLTTNFTKVSEGKWLYQAVGDDGNVLPGTQMGEIAFDTNGKVSSVKTLTPPVDIADQTIKFDSIQMDSELGSSKIGYFTAYDKTNVMHNYEVQFTNSGTSWNYSVSEAGVTGGTPVAQGTLVYDTTTKAYKQTVTSGAGVDNFTLSDGKKITLDFSAASQAAPDLNAFDFTPPSPFSATTKITLDSVQLDSTLGAVHYKNFTVFDENNSPRVLQMKITTDSASSWNYEVTEPGVASSTPITGKIDTTNGISDLTIDKQTIKFDTSAGLTSLADKFSMNSSLSYATGISQANIMYVPVNGQPAMSVAFDLSKITQFSSGTTNGTNGTTIQALSQDGYAQGTLDSISIDNSGIIVGKFTNERQQNLGQVALATFNNAGGLLKKGETVFAKTSNSGEAQVGAAGSGGRGVINPGTLEMSNVDLAQEFSNMITTQRGFQANSKIISVADEMLQDINNLKR